MQDVPLPWEVDRHHPKVLELARKLDKSSVLDIGCGRGLNALLLAQYGLEVVGLDSSKSAITQAREKAKETGVECTFLVGDALNLQEIADTFDAALGWNILQHIDPNELKQYVAGVGDILNENGLYVSACFAGKGEWKPGFLRHPTYHFSKQQLDAAFDRFEQEAYELLPLDDFVRPAFIEKAPDLQTTMFHYYRLRKSS